MCNRTFVVVGLLALLTGCSDAATPVVPEPETVTSSSSLEAQLVMSSGASSVSSQSSATELRPSVLLKAPFAPQAPTANWDAEHEETCEEMSLILVALAKQGIYSLTPEEAEVHLQKLLEYERAHQYGEDITVAELQAIAKNYYNLDSEVISVREAEDLERPLNQGKFVIVPLAGRELGNPYFSGDGPWYHMVLLTGYTQESFITHDVGTRRGRNYEYEKLRFLNAIHDWTGVKEEIFRGERKALVIQ